MSTIIDALKKTQLQKKKGVKGADEAVENLPLGREIKDHIVKTPLLRRRILLVVAGIVGTGLLSAAIFFFYQRFFSTGMHPDGQVQAVADSAAVIQPEKAQQEDFVALNASGMKFLGAGQTSQAIACFEKAIALQSKFPPAYNNLGVAYMKSGQIDKAIENFHAAVTLMSNYAEAHVNLAIAYESRENYFEALSHYQEFIETAPALYADLKQKISHHIGSK